MFTPNFTIEEKKVIVDECMASGLSRAEFCRRRGINASTLDGWLNRFYPGREKKTQSNCTGLVKIQSAVQDREFVMVLETTDFNQKMTTDFNQYKYHRI